MQRPSQTAAASSKLIPSGMCATAPLSRTHTYSACARRSPSTPKTRSPTANSVTAAPTLDLAGELHAEDLPLRPADAREEARRRTARRCASRSPCG